MVCKLFFLLFFFLIAAQGNAQEMKCGYYPDGKIRYKGFFLNSKPVGELIRYYPEGGVSAKMNHKGDTVRVILYSQDGENTSTGNYIRQKKSGVWKYYKGEQLIACEEYANHLLNGKSVRYDLNGQLVEQKYWKNGKREGEWKLYYNNGQLRLQAFYVDNDLNGEMRNYSREGQLRVKGVYKNNLKEGDWMYYDLQGNLVKKQVFHAGIPENSEQQELEESRQLDALIASGKKIPDPAVFVDDPEAYMRLTGME